MKRCFVDTSAFFALMDRDDAWHGPAVDFAREAAKDRCRLVTSDYVIDEALTLARMRLGHPAAIRFGEKVQSSNWLEVHEVTTSVRDAAWDVFVRFSDQDFSFTDCTSFALMRETGILEAFTFDRRHFGAAGFTPVP